MRPTIHILPLYIGVLKYFERLLPYFEKKYAVSFVLLTREDGDGPVKKEQEMARYCEEKGYSYFILNEGMRKTPIRIPFFTPIKKRYEHRNACRKFLNSHRPVKVITSKARNPHHTFLREAERLGVETIILQWSFGGVMDKSIYNKPSASAGLFQKLYSRTLEKCAVAIDTARGDVEYDTTAVIPRKIGLIDELQDVKRYADSYNPQSISIVGSADIQIAYDLKNHAESDILFKKNLYHKYSLDPRKATILVIPFRFHSHWYNSGMREKEQSDHWLGIVKNIKAVYRQEELNLVIKIHPSDQERIYAPLRAEGIHVLKNAFLEEVLAITDLCITDPFTTANYMVLGSNVHAIFINFSTLKLETGMPYYHILRTVNDREEFIEMVRRFKQGALEKQYDNSSVEMRSIEKIVSFLGQ